MRIGNKGVINCEDIGAVCTACLALGGRLGNSLPVCGGCVKDANLSEIQGYGSEDCI